MKNIIEAIERKPLLTIVGLLAFHIFVACLMSWIAHTSFLSHLHGGLSTTAINQPGLWNFARDSILYHNETAPFINAINSGDWSKWWSGEFGSIIINETHMHVKWLALLYWLTGEENPLLFEIINSVTWVTSVVLIFLTARLLFPQNKVIAYLSTAFLFFPSFLLSSTQLLRDPLYTLGFCFTILGWVAIFHKDYQWKGVFSIIIGFYLVTGLRPYTGPIMTTSFISCTIIFILRKNIALYPAATMLLGILFVFYQPDIRKKTHPTSLDQSKEITVPLATHNTVANLQDFVQDILDTPKEKVRSNNRVSAESLISLINDHLVSPLNYYRKALLSVSYNSKSTIDTGVQFINIKELISYLPRAVQIGFLSPFPHHWISPGTETGLIGRVLAGLETLIIYAIFIGFVSAFFIGMEIFKPLAPVLIFSGLMIVLLGLVVPIAGTIFRMRQGLFIPIFILGVYGLQILSIKIKSAIKKKENHITR
jgi:hypothetical protein